MVARAEGKFLRVSPRKVRLVIDLIKGTKPARALSVLEHTKKKGAPLLAMVIKSALSNAKARGYQDEMLFISRIVANPGPAMKRYQAASFGRASVVRKKTSHIVVELDSTSKIIENVKVK